MGSIDTHQHIVPDFYAAWVNERGLNGAGFALPQWSAASALETMDRLEIDAAIVSVSTPGVFCDDLAESVAMAQRINDFAADLCRSHPGRFGYFAMLPLPDVETSLAELARAADELGADGVVLLANVNGQYLGDAAFDPVIEAIADRGLPIFVHPSFLPCAPLANVPPFMADFLLDTTRAALNLVRSGTMDRYPKLDVILSHAGGFLPYAAYRVASLLDADIEVGADRLRRFWFDTALSAAPASVPTLSAFADPSRILFGTDLPFAPEPTATWHRNNLDTLFDDNQRARVLRSNAEALFPRLALKP